MLDPLPLFVLFGVPFRLLPNWLASVEFMLLEPLAGPPPPSMLTFFFSNSMRGSYQNSHVS